MTNDSHMGLKIITPPTTEQITLEEARLHLRVTPDDDSPPAHPDDPLILALVSAARDYCEQNLFRGIAPQIVELVLDCFPPGAIKLPMSPIVSILSVKYTDGNGVEQTLSSTGYVLDNYSEPGRLVPAVSTTWPATLSGAVNAVKVRYDCGYSLPLDSPNYHPLPASIRSTMLLLIGHWYENREAVVVGTINSPLSFAVEVLLKPYQLRMSMS